MDRSRFSCERPEKHPPNPTCCVEMFFSHDQSELCQCIVGRERGRLPRALLLKSAVLGGLTTPFVSQRQIGYRLRRRRACEELGLDWADLPNK